MIVLISVEMLHCDNISNLSLFLSGMCFPVSRINSSSVGMYCKHNNIIFKIFTPHLTFLTNTRVIQGGNQPVLSPAISPQISLSN